LEICADLLHAAEGGARKTQLVYRANLNFSIIGRYLSVLTKNGLLDADPPLYVATEKGKEFLQVFGEYEKEHGEIEKHAVKLENGKEELENMLVLE